MSPDIVKVQVTAEFVLDDGEYKVPGVFGPVQLTAREWAEFDLQAEIDKAVEGHNAEKNRAERRKRPKKKGAKR